MQLVHDLRPHGESVVPMTRRADTYTMRRIKKAPRVIDMCGPNAVRRRGSLSVRNAAQNRAFFRGYFCS